MHYALTHWGRVTHIYVGKVTIIGSDNGLSPGRRQAIIWTNAGILLIEPFGTNFSEILIETHTFSFKKIRLKMSSGKRRPFCLGLNVLNGMVLMCMGWYGPYAFFVVHRAGLLWSQQDLSGYDLSHYQVPHCIKSFLLFCLIYVYSSQFSILFWIMYLL